MGGDCCGGAATPDSASIAAVDAAQAQLADMRVNDAHSASKPSAAKPAANGAAPAQPPAKSDADIAKEKQPYFQKRIQLFEEYRERELHKLDEAKQADVSIKGTHAFLKLNRDMSMPQIVLAAYTAWTHRAGQSGRGRCCHAERCKQLAMHVVSCCCTRFCRRSAPHHACGACGPHI